MILKSEMGLDLQQVLTQILVTPIVLQMAIAMAAATQGRFWLVVTETSECLSWKFSMLTKTAQPTYNLLNKPSKFE